MVGRLTPPPPLSLLPQVTTILDFDNLCMPLCMTLHIFLTFPFKKRKAVTRRPWWAAEDPLSLNTWGHFSSNGWPRHLRPSPWRPTSSRAPQTDPLVTTHSLSAFMMPSSPPWLYAGLLHHRKAHWHRVGQQSPPLFFCFRNGWVWPEVPYECSRSQLLVSAGLHRGPDVHISSRSTTSHPSLWLWFRSMVHSDWVEPPPPLPELALCYCAVLSEEAVHCFAKSWEYTYSLIPWHDHVRLASWVAINAK